MNTNSNLWFDSFLRKTENMSRPTLMENQIDFRFNKFLQKNILDVFLKFSLVNYPKRIRLYLDDYTDIDASNLFLKFPPKSDDTFHSWANRAFTEKTFGIILNSTQNYSDKLAVCIYDLFFPITDILGKPYGGFDITFFLGNYGFTPLGFHQDPIGNSVTHLHLGPGKKIMYLIDKETFENKLKHITFTSNGYNGCKEYDKIIPHCVSYTINEGDVFFMPPGYYHVGYSEELSAAITVWFMQPSIQDYQNRTLIKMSDMIFNDSNNKVIESNKNQSGIDNILKEMSPFFKYDIEYSNLKLKDLFPKMIYDHFLELESNAFFNSKTYLIKDDSAIDNNTHFKNNYPFKIIYHILSNQSIILFLRGHRIVIPFNSNFNHFIEGLYFEEGISLKKILKFLSAEWEDDVILDLIKTLLNIRAIIIV